MKKIIVVLLMCLFSVVLLTGCNAKKVTKVGILQLVTHDALNAATEGFIEGLKEAGFVDGENIEIIIKNPEADNQTLNQMANVLVRDCDLVLGVATDAAVALLNARDNNGLDIPVFFTAVTDPVDAKLVPAWTDTKNGVSGTSDMNDVAGQIAMIKKIIPTANTMTILYHSSEVNSKVQAELAKTAALNDGIRTEVKTVNEVSELQATLTAIINSGVKVVYLPTDNLVASNMATITEALNEAGIITICGEEAMVANGGSASLSINYRSLGIQTAKMAAKFLNGTAMKDIPVEQGAADSLAINEESLTAMGFDVAAIKASLK